MGAVYQMSEKKVDEFTDPKTPYNADPTDRQGFIKLDRNILKNCVFDNEKLLKVWIWCLLKASHEKRKKKIGHQTIELQPGQFYTGRHNAASELKMSPTTAWRYLKTLEQDGKVDIKSNNKFSVVTLVNWGFYQHDKYPNGQQNGQQTDIKWTSNGHKQESKEGKEKNNYTPEFEEFWSEYPRKKEKAKAFKVWNTRLREGHTVDEMITAAKNYAVECVGRDEKYIKHGSTFIGPDKPFLEYIEKRAVKKKTFDSSKYQYPSQDPRNFRVL